MSTKICPKCGTRPSRVTGQTRYCSKCITELNDAFEKSMMAYYRSLPSTEVLGETEWKAEFCKRPWKDPVRKIGFWEFPSYIWTVIVDYYMESNKELSYAQTLQLSKHSTEFPFYIWNVILDRKFKETGGI